MKPFEHSLRHAKRWGGNPEDYVAVDDFIDISKAAHPTMAHRMMLHNSMGAYVAEKVFGHNITNSDGRLVSVRDIVEQHILQDLGFIPSLTDWIKEVPMKPWMIGSRTVKITKKDLVD